RVSSKSASCSSSPTFEMSSRPSPSCWAAQSCSGSLRPSSARERVCAPVVTEVVLNGETRVAPRWHRVVLKLSGEALASSLSDETIDASTVGRLAKEISSAQSELGIQIAIVVGGGNIWRGTTGAGQGMDRATSDIMGMLGTVINALALQDALEHAGCPTRVLSAIHMAEVCAPYIRRRAIRHLEKGLVVIFAAGMGNPYFTTDTPAALRAAEIEADAILKGTH